MKASTKKTQENRTKGLVFKKEIVVYKIDCVISLENDEINAIKKHKLEFMPIFEGLDSDDIFEDDGRINTFGGERFNNHFNIGTAIWRIAENLKKGKTGEAVFESERSHISAIAKIETHFIESMRNVKRVLSAHMENSDALSSAGSDGITNEIEL